MDKTKPKHFLDIADLTKKDFLNILELSEDIKKYPDKYSTALKNKTLIMYFAKPSTRTRLSFEAGMTQLGGHAIFFQGGQIDQGKEDLRDTAAMYSRFGDIVMARVYKQSYLEELAKYSTIPVINGLSNERHPVQVLADLLTIKEKKGLDGIVVAWVGDGNNVCASLSLACAYADTELRVATPDIEKHKLSKDIVQEVKALNGRLYLHTTAEAAVKDADVVVTDTWLSMGDPPAEMDDRKRIFAPYQVNKTLMALAKPNAIFMHCLPAYRGCEVTAEIIDGEQSVVYDEAENRLHTQKALMIHLLDKK